MDFIFLKTLKTRGDPGFRWKAARLFNNMPKNIRNLTVCSTLCFKKKLDLHLSTIPDLPNTPNLGNSLDNKYKL